MFNGFVFLVCTCLAATAWPQEKPQPPVKVLIETQLGKIVIEVDSVHAPVTAASRFRIEGGRP